MASHNDAKQTSSTEHEESETELPPTDGESDAETSEIDEEEMNSWLKPTYKPKFFAKRPMKAPLTAPWGLAVSDADLQKLKTGFKSRCMEDKWDLLVEDPDASGGVSVHIIRNWLQEDCYVLHISPRKQPGTGGDDDADAGAAVIRGITWEGDKNRLQCLEEQARKEAVMLCRGWLGCEFETLPQYPSSMFWDPKGYKKLDKPEAQPGSDADSSTAAATKETKEVDPSLRLHVMSLGGRYWNEGG